MTFFANAGITWPRSEAAQLQRAGYEALAGGADLWRLISILEGRESDRGDAYEEQRVRISCVQQLRRAAEIYSNALDGIGTFQLFCRRCSIIVSATRSCCSSVSDLRIPRRTDKVRRRANLNRAVINRSGNRGLKYHSEIGEA